MCSLPQFAAATYALAHLLLLAAVADGTASDLTCGYGRLPFTCYTGCVEDCDNSTACVVSAVCESGCFCPEGLLEYDSELCVQEEQCLDGFMGEIQPVDKCSVYDSCNECISADPDCQWCPYEPDDESVKGERCRERGVNPVCPKEIIDPVPGVRSVIDDSFTDVIQVRPQRLEIALRAGQPEQITLQFKPSRNFPLDVYFLLDVTGSFSQSFRDTVTPLATQLVAALRNISEGYAVAFGSFGDKRAIPYAISSDNINAYRTGFPNYMNCVNGRIKDINDCNPTISFRHTTNFSPLTNEQLQYVLGNISIHLNVDSLEGGLDGLVQVLACQELIGWRQPSLRMLLYMSNAEFHLAGDGKVGAAFQPNPGECNLEPDESGGQEFYEYTKDRVYDYPSAYQLRQLLQKYQTNVVFAISDSSGSDSILEKYRALEAELGLGAMLQITRLQSNARNLVSVIRTSYDSITQEIRLTPDEEVPGLTFTYSAGENCNISEDGRVCTDVALDTTVSMVVTVNMTSCLPNNTIVNLRSAAFGTVELSLIPLCDCPCTTEEEPAAEQCSGSGTLRCGVCHCDEGRSGDSCECEGDTATCGVGLNNEECSGRGRGYCDCGTCVCYIQEQLLRARNITEPYFGDQCECNHFGSCGGITEDGELCSGRGVCNCDTDKCECTATEPVSGRPYTGDMCECNPDFCYNENYPDRTCVYTGSLNGTTDAECGCNECECDRNGAINAEPAGDGTCKPGQPRCSQLEQCARCAKGLQSSNTDCDELGKERCMYDILTDESSPVDPTSEECFFQDGDCTYTFYIIPTTSSTIQVEDDPDCKSTGGGSNNLVWIIPVSVVAALLVLGILALLIVLFIFWCLDRYEFRKFQTNLEGADWVPQENPIYVSPQQEYTNIAYKRSSRKKHE